MSPRPRVFVGSSAEALHVANAIHANLERAAEVTVWDKAFEPSSYTLEALQQQLEQADFGVFVLQPDDGTRIRRRSLKAVRDNVILELGMFLGQLGRARTFFAKPRDSDQLRIPTDLGGITAVEYDSQREDRNWRAALAPACAGMLTVIEREGRRVREAANMNRLIAEPQERAGSPQVSPEAVAADRVVMSRIRELIGSAVTSGALRRQDYGSAFRGEIMDDIEAYLFEAVGADHEFVHELLEMRRQALIEHLRRFRHAVATQTFPVTASTGIYSVDPSARFGADRSARDTVVSEMNSTASEAADAYDELVREAKRTLGSV